MKKAKPPNTDSIEELARFWDTHDATDFDDEFEEVTEPVFVRKPLTVVHSTKRSTLRRGNQPKVPKPVSRTFSERYGHKPIRKALQLESMDDALRNSIWNTFVELYLESDSSPLRELEGSYERKLLRSVWTGFFKLSCENLKSAFYSDRDLVHQRFCALSWNEVYDFLEFLVESRGRNSELFTDSWNKVLEKEGAGYRFVGMHVTPIIAESEISTIEDATETPYGNVNEHIRRSITLMADRTAPDFRNAIKESICAVEALARSITGQPKASLGQALRELERERGLHPALKSAFSSLYGYSSDKGGIRHALLEESDLDFSEAKFMLVSCSAFINFVIARSSDRKVS